MTRCPRDVAHRDVAPEDQLDPEHPARELARTHIDGLAYELGRYLDNEHRTYADTKVRK